MTLKSFVTRFTCLNAWNMKSSLACSSSNNAMSTFVDSFTWFFNSYQFQKFMSNLFLQSTLVACLWIGSCKAPRFFVISTSSKITKTLFDIMHYLILSKYSSTSSSLRKFQSSKFCNFFLTSLMSFDFTSFKKLDFSYWLWYGVCVFCCCWCALVLAVRKIRKFFDKALLWSIFYYFHSCFFKIVWCWRIRIKHSLLS